MWRSATLCEVPELFGQELTLNATGHRHRDMFVFFVLIMIFMVLIAIIVAAATGNRRANYQMGPGVYIEPEPVYIDDTPLIAGMIAADVAEEIAFSHGGHMGGMDQGQYYDSQDSGFDGGGNDFLGGDSGFSDSSSGFDMGGGGDF